MTGIGAGADRIEVGLPAGARAIPELDGLWAARPGGRSAEAVDRGAAFHKVFKGDGPVRGIRTIDLLHFPYPVAFAFWQAAPTRARWLVMRNRMQVIEFEGFDGVIRTILVNPSEHDLSLKAPFFAHARAELVSAAPDSLARAIPGPAARLRAIGIDPAKIDFVTFDHLHVQDLRRGLVGEDGAPPLYPNAQLLVNVREIESVRAIHPLQRPWWIEGALDGVPAAKIVALEGSAWLGKGLALVFTPGHTRGNHSIVFHAPGRGVFAVSENGVCPDSYLPRASRLPNLRHYAVSYGAEVVLNGNALEDTMAQYDSMLLERAIADRGDCGGEVPNVYSSSPFVRSPLAWGLGPTFTIAPIHGGALTAAAG
jgi:hypothetical protein